MLQRWIERSNTVQKKCQKGYESALFCYYPNKDRHAEATIRYIDFKYKVFIQAFMHYEFT